MLSDDVPSMNMPMPSISFMKELTQKMLAQRVGMSQSVIARIESGERGISVDTLGRVAHAIGKKIQLA